LASRSYETSQPMFGQKTIRLAAPKIDTGIDPGCNERMVSAKVETGLRIVDGLFVIVLGVLSVVLFWTGSFDFWLRLLASAYAVLVAGSGLLVLFGRSGRGSGTLRLTRRWWKYVFVGVCMTATVVVAVISSPSFLRHPAFPLFPCLMGLSLVQLFEPEASRNFRASKLSSRDAGKWKRVMIASAIAAAILSLQAVISALLGGFYVTVVAVPLAVSFLVMSAAIWVMLKARTKELENEP
jgi:hypothetical protein